MNYLRPVSRCGATASDLAGEVVAGLSAASLVFKDNVDYARQLMERATTLFDLTIQQEPSRQGTHTTNHECGGEALPYYNSTSFRDELVWGATWLFLATGNSSYLTYATGNFTSAVDEEVKGGDKGVLYWNNKQLGNVVIINSSDHMVFGILNHGSVTCLILDFPQVLLTRLLYFHDLGYPYEDALSSSREMTESAICSYLTDKHFRRTPGTHLLPIPSGL